MRPFFAAAETELSPSTFSPANHRPGITNSYSKNFHFSIHLIFAIRFAVLTSKIDEDGSIRKFGPLSQSSSFCCSVLPEKSGFSAVRGIDANISEFFAEPLSSAAHSAGGESILLSEEPFLRRAATFKFFRHPNADGRGLETAEETQGITEVHERTIDESS